MPEISLSEATRTQLSEALLEEQDLLGSLQGHPVEEVPERPGLYRCRCVLAVRRPLDPETSELRRLEVFLRRAGEGYEVFEVRGLEGLAAQLE